MDKRGRLNVYSGVKQALLCLLSVVPAGLLAHEGHVHATLGGFSNLHPLVVHLPLTALCVVPVLQALAIFQNQKLLQGTTIAFLLTGAIGAYLSSGVFHPDTTDLGETANALLDAHDAWADRTMVFTLLALAPACAALFVARFQRALKLASLVLCLGAAICVGITGHHGAELVHIHGVGAEGNYIKEPKQ